MISWSFFSDKIAEIWVDVMYNDISLKSVLLTFEDDYYLGKRISTSYYNAWCHW